MPLAAVVVPVLTDSLKAKILQSLPDGAKSLQENEMIKFLADLQKAVEVIKATAT